VKSATGILALLLAATTGGCVQEQANSAVSPTRSASAAPGSAVVRCTSEGTAVETPVAQRANGGGVAVEVRNATGQEMVFNYNIDDGAGGGGEERVAPGVTALVVPFALRVLGVACLTPEEDADILDFAIDFEPIAVVPARRERLACGSGAYESGSTPMEGATSAAFVARSRSFLARAGALEVGDRFTVPDASVVEVRRDGRLVARFEFIELDGPHRNVAYALCAGA
jgi:hypothetical protein